MTMYESYSAYRGSDGSGSGSEFVPDPAILRKLRLLVETDDQQYPALKKLKMCGRELSDLPPEVYEMVELEVLEDVKL